MTDRCGGKKRQGEGTCTQAAGWGTSHAGTGRCKLHGGSTPTQEAGAARIELERTVRRYLDNPDAEPMRDPGDKLLRLASRIEAAVDAVGDRVNMLTEVSVQTIAGGEQVKAEVQVWDKLLGRLHAILVDIQKLGLMDREVKLAEQQATMLSAALRDMVAEARLRLDLNEAEGAALMDLVGEMLQRLERIDSGAKVS